MKSKDNFVRTIYNALQFYKVQITLDSLEILIKTNCQYPSLIAICDTLDELKIKHNIYKLPLDELTNLEQPFIAHTTNSKGDILFIHKIERKFVHFVDDSRKIIKADINDFIKGLSGIVIVLSPSKESGAINYVRETQNETLFRVSQIASVILLILFCFVIGDSRSYIIDFSSSIAFALKLLGISISLLLVLEEYRKENRFTKKLCNISSQFNCKSVLDSPYSKIFGNITLADLSIIYFTTGLMLLIAFPNSLNVLGLFSFLALGIVPMSLYFQIVKVKKICPLCLSLLLILTFEFIFLFNTVEVEYKNFREIFVFVMLCFFQLVLLYLLKTNWLLRLEKQSYKYSSSSFKRNPIVFNSLLKTSIKQPTVDESLVFHLGNKNSSNSILAFLSLSCDSCFSELKNLVKIFKDSYDVKIDFVFIINELEPLGVLNSLHYIKETKDEGYLISALFEWYENKQYKKWLQNYPTPKDYNKLQSLCENNSEIFEGIGVTKLPSLYFNSFFLPENYDIIDLRQFIDKKKK
ncbi:MAG: hypothetical protein JEZ09_18645 [Salinivirgaceae bacterium]|nr:hypothetical protein [Salinivirgaceae bacterium]